jgi:O-antigen/teichoic acid export membrane protein
VSASSRTPARRGALLSSSALLAVGLAVSQVLAYALNVLGARLLGPAEFGELGSLLGLIVIGNVASLAVQAVTARRVSRGEAAEPLGRTALVVAAAAAGAAVASVPVLAPALRLSPVALVAVALALLPLTLTGWTLGAAQGAQRYGTLAAMYALAPGLRIGVALAALVATGDVTATAVATLAGTLAGWLVVRPLARAGWPSPGRPDRSVGWEAVHAGLALLAMFTLTSVDVVVARALLVPEGAGQYAAGGILVKIAFWLPQAVVISAFPRLSSGEPGVLRRAAVLMAVVGAAGVLLAMWLGPAVVPAVLGDDYPVAASSAGVFVAAGVAQSLAYLMVFERLAAQDRAAAILVWGAVVLLLVLAATIGRSSPIGLAWSVVAASTALAAAGALLRRRKATAPA